VHPSERVRFPVETARALLEGRLSAEEAAAAVALQVDQVLPHLRNDRDAVTRHESESVATTLRLLAEQVADRRDPAAAMGDDDADEDPHAAIAAALGRLAQALR